MITLIVSVNGVLRPTQCDYTDSVCECSVDLPPNMITLIVVCEWGVETPAQRDYTDSVREWGVETHPA